jgi:hypothetical protein
MKKLSHDVFAASVERWRADNSGLDRVAQAITRSLDKQKLEIPALNTGETIRVLASTFRLSDRLHAPLLKNFWFNVGTQVFMQEVYPTIDYGRTFKMEDGEAPKTRRGRKPLPETSGNGPEPLRPRDYTAPAEEAL